MKDSKPSQDQGRKQLHAKKTKQRQTERRTSIRIKTNIDFLNMHRKSIQLKEELSLMVYYPTHTPPPPHELWEDLTSQLPVLPIICEAGTYFKKEIKPLN